MFKNVVSIPAYVLCMYVKIGMYFPLVNINFLNMAKDVYSNVFPTFYPWSFSFSGPASVCSHQNYAAQQIVCCGCSLTETHFHKRLAWWLQSLALSGHSIVCWNLCWMLGAEARGGGGRIKKIKEMPSSCRGTQSLRRQTCRWEGYDCASQTWVFPFSWIQTGALWDAGPLFKFAHGAWPHVRCQL